VGAGDDVLDGSGEGGGQSQQQELNQASSEVPAFLPCGLSERSLNISEIKSSSSGGVLGGVRTMGLLWLRDAVNVSTSG
jgi:hypothetical protein